MLSGGWNDERPNELLLVDPFASALLRYDDKGRRVAPGHRDTVAGSVARLRPIEAWPLAGGGLVVEGAGTRLARIEFGGDHASPPLNVAEEAELVEVFPQRWGLTHDSLREGGFVMCGEIETAQGWSAPGYFYLPLQGDRTPIELMSFADRGDGQALLYGCKLGGQVVAAVKGTGYVLVFDPSPTIRRVDPSAAPGHRLPTLELEPVPDEMKLRPVLPNLVMRDQYPSLMKEVERSRTPVELIGWGDALYVLLRRPSEVSGTEWSLAKIILGPDDTGRVEVATLESGAQHISIVPGAERWAFIEKAAPESLGKQKVLGFKYVPTDLIVGLEDGQPLCR